MKIKKFYNKKEGKEQYRARFQLSGKEFRPVADARKKLLDMIDEIRAQEHRTKYELPITKHFRTVQELFDEHLRRLRLQGDRKKISIFKRVSEKLLKLAPPDIKINQIKKGHFQKYIDTRLTEKNPQSEEFILPDTVNKELSAVSVALKNAQLYFSELEDEQIVRMPKAKTTKRRRERMVEKTGELAVLLTYLRRPLPNPKIFAHRRDLADDLEMRYETGLRRKEITRLKKTQYYRDEAALRDVKRWKTGTITKFFPLTERAVAIIESRLDSNSEYIFSKNGNPTESYYRTLKTVCGHLKLNYGTHKEGGWVPHDLRHNFATEIVRVTDIETAKSLTGHTGMHILTYLHTDEKRQREAMNKREGKELKAVLTELYNQTRNGNIEISAFIEKTINLIRNG
ncbi:MAG TPA: tyrosine-type recombinase/integrase [Pyrinomonadaceae bacterium]